MPPIMPAEARSLSVGMLFLGGRDEVSDIAIMVHRDAISSKEVPL